GDGDALMDATTAMSAPANDANMPVLDATEEGGRVASGVPPYLDVDGVCKVFQRRGQKTVALRDVNLRVAKGEFGSARGPSGCGKSTPLRVIGGLVDADLGRVAVGGATAAQARGRKQFGLVPQSPALLPWQSVDQNVRFLTDLHKRAQAPTQL